MYNDCGLVRGLFIDYIVYYRQNQFIKPPDEPDKNVVFQDVLF